MAAVVDQLKAAPPTADEFALLAEVTQEPDISPGQIAARLRGTRLWHFLQLLARQDQRIVAYLSLLLTIYAIFVQAEPARAPAPQINININIDVKLPTDEIVKQIEQHLDEEEHGKPPTGQPPTRSGE